MIPYFSVIIPTLNEEKYIPRLLGNLNQQTFTDFDVYVVDGKSSDNTPQLVSSFEAKYPLILLKKNTRGVSNQRNSGAKKSKGKVLIFFDADTQIPKNFLEKIHQAFEDKHPHLLTTYMKPDIKDPSALILASFFNQIAEVGRVIKYPSVFGAMMAIKKTIFMDLGGFDKKITYGEDSELFLRALDYKYNYIILTQPKYIFSFRRFRHEGTLDTIIKYIRLSISISANGIHAPHPKYDMGGQIYASNNKPPDPIKRFEKFFETLNKTPKNGKDATKKSIKQIFASK